MIDLTQSRPFSASTLPPRGQETNIKDKVVERSRQQYSVDRQVVESRIKQWTEKQFIPGRDEEVINRLRRELWGRE